MSIMAWIAVALITGWVAKTMILGRRNWGTQAIIAIGVSATLPFLGLSGVASAQSAVNVQGTIAAVDCQRQTMSVETANGRQTFAASGNAFTNVDATNLPFCSLEGYVGAPATVWLALGDNNQLLVTEVNVTGPVATAPATTEVVSTLPLWGIVLGTVVDAGLLYLVTRGPDGNYYRYPYYGGYYRHYYHSGYRPYTGFYPASAPIITVALAIIGAVIGMVIVDGDPYIVSNYGGHYYRYPYYGPYHQYYYRPAYQGYQRPYAGANVNVYVNASVRQGDSHWDAPAHAMAQVYGTPAVRDFPQQQPKAGTHQLTGTPSHKPQSVTHQPMAPAPQKSQPATHQPTAPAPQKSQPATHQPTAPAPQKLQPATHQPAGKSQNQQPQCGGKGQQPCSNQGSNQNGSSK